MTGDLEAFRLDPAERSGLRPRLATFGTNRSPHFCCAATTAVLDDTQPGLIYFQISDDNDTMPRRRPGALLTLEVSILAALRDGGTEGIHGFALARAIGDAEESRRLTATGTLYRALHRLDDAGLIENWWEDPNDAAQAGRPRRRFYRITGAGATALARAQAEADTLAVSRLDPGYAS